MTRPSSPGSGRKSENLYKSISWHQYTELIHLRDKPFSAATPLVLIGTGLLQLVGLITLNLPEWSFDRGNPNAYLRVGDHEVEEIS